MTTDLSALRGSFRFAWLLLPGLAAPTALVVDRRPVVIPGSANVGATVGLVPPPKVALVVRVVLFVRVPLPIVPPDHNVVVSPLDILVVLDPSAAEAWTACPLATAVANASAPTAVRQYWLYRLVTATMSTASPADPAASPEHAALAQLVRAWMATRGAERHAQALSKAVPEERAQGPAAEAMSPSWRHADTQGAWVTTTCWVGRLNGWSGAAFGVVVKTVGMLERGFGDELLPWTSTVTRPVRTTLRVNWLAGVPTASVTGCVMVYGAKITWPAASESSMIPAMASRRVLLKLRAACMA